MDLDKYSVKKRRDRLISKEQRYFRRVLVYGFKLALSCIVLGIIIMAGAGFGMMKGILDDAPDVSTIDIKPKGFKTIIYDQDGNEIDSLSTINSNRIYVYYEDIPKTFVDAFVSIEDERFWDHNGIDVRGIFRALYRDVVQGNMKEGASTITQQLIKNQVFNVGMGEITKLDRIKRKVWEQQLAIQLEKKYSKEQIMEYYLNTIYLGQGVNGIEAAAQRYFDKSIGDLSLSEIAMIAGITQNPYQYDPVIFPDSNANRRIDVLNKMLELGYITDAEYTSAKNDDVYARVKEVKKVNDDNFQYNSYFKDALMNAFVKDLMEMYGMSRSEAFNEMYTGGYSIYSTQDFAIQEVCDRVANDPQYYPSKVSYALNYKLTLMDSDGVTQHYYDQNTLVSYYKQQTGNSKYNNIYPSEDLAREAADRYKEALLDENGGSFVSEEIKFAIQPQTSISVIDQHTGYVKAITGGRGEKTENLGFNRATDAKRQPGSCFKVLAAFLPFIDTMGGLCNMFEDKPYKFENGVQVRNWYGGYKGWASIRQGVKESMNIIAVQAITAVTPEVAFRYLERMGFTTLVDRYVSPSGSVFSDIQQATALGGLTYGITNLEITAAYAAIANMGMYIKPCFYSQVYDHDGKIVIDNTNPSKLSTTHAICKETTAWQLLEAMKDVIRGGTGVKARLKTGGVCAGKTGTTSNCYDLWFCGMTPYYTASVWYGMDSNVYADTQLHKYMWRDVMDGIAEVEGDHDNSLDWPQPEGLTKVTVCRFSGMLPSEGCPTSTDWCAVENVPSKRCKGGHETKIRICNESHMRATNACPDVTEYDVMSGGDNDSNKQIVGADFPYDQSIFSSSCPLHPAVEGDHTIVTRVLGEGGSIDGSVGVSDGGSCVIHIYPSAGYSIETVWIDGEPKGNVSEYGFENISGNHTVTVQFKKDETEAPTEAPTTEAPTTEAPTEAPTTEAPTEAPTEQPAQQDPDPGAGEGE